ncbi:MAG: hypothetical protein ACWGQW_22935 [bacterium]
MSYRGRERRHPMATRHPNRVIEARQRAAFYERVKGDLALIGIGFALVFMIGVLMS